MSAAVLTRLALTEARRVTLHPLLVGYSLLLPLLLLGALGQGADGSAREVTVDALSTWFLFGVPILVPFAANLVASSARRAHADEMFAALPTGPARRAVAACLAGVGPAVCALAAGAGLYVLTHPAGRPDGEAAFAGWHLASLPLVYLGAAAYGVAVARWLPFPGAALVCVVVLFAWFGFTHSPGSSPLAVVTAPYYLTPLADGVEGTGAPGASDGWHAAYLASLVLAAATAAALRERPRLLLGAAPVLVALAAACTALTLP